MSRAPRAKCNPFSATRAAQRNPCGRYSVAQNTLRADNGDVPTVRTQSALARSLGCHPGTIARLLKRSDCPFPAGPWPAKKIQALKAWRGSLQSDRSGKADTAALRRTKKGRAGSTSRGPTEPAADPVDARAEETLRYADIKTRAQATKAAADAERAVLETQRLKGELIDRDTLDRAVLALASLFKRATVNMADGLVADLPCPEAESDPIVKQHVDAMMRDLADRTSLSLDSVDEALEAQVRARRNPRGRKSPSTAKAP